MHLLFTFYKLDRNVEYKGFTFIYIMYKCWLTSKVFFIRFIHLSYTQFNKSHRISRYKANHNVISSYLCTSYCLTFSDVALCALLFFICAIKPGNLP